jgi:hypothetical protein
MLDRELYSQDAKCPKCDGELECTWTGTDPSDFRRSTEFITRTCLNCKFTFRQYPLDYTKPSCKDCGNKDVAVDTGSWDSTGEKKPIWFCQECILKKLADARKAYVSTSHKTTRQAEAISAMHRTIDGLRKQNHEFRERLKN